MSARGSFVSAVPRHGRSVRNWFGLLMFTALCGGVDSALCLDNAALFGPALVQAQAQTPADRDSEPDSGVADDASADGAPTATENPIRPLDLVGGPTVGTDCGGLNAAGLAGLVLAGLVALGFRSSNRQVL